MLLEGLTGALTAIGAMSAFGGSGHGLLDPVQEELIFSSALVGSGRGIGAGSDFGSGVLTCSGFGAS